MTAPARIGRYELVRRLSKSMTDVYLAIDTVENRQAALKLVKSGPDLMTQLVLEAERRGAALQRQLRSLDSRVVEVYDYGDADGYFFVAMQYVEGRNLAQVLNEERRIPPERAAEVAMEVAGQLAKFHSWNAEGAVVHGDIKPSNIHLGMNGTVRLLDFGVAKMLRAGRAATMHSFGSPGYCSPERLARLEVDQQSDLWALGATLYEMLAGQPPYQAEDTQKLERLIQARRPPRALPESCPKPLRAIVSKVLAPDARRRYASAQALQEDLAAYLAGRTTAAEVERRPVLTASPTLEAARGLLKKATRTLRFQRHGKQAAVAALWFVLGAGLWIGGNYALQMQARPKVQAAAPVPADGFAILRGEYVRTATQVMDGYRASKEADVRNFDWSHGAAGLERLTELGVRDREVTGKLALLRGYVLLAQLTDRKLVGADAAAARSEARDLFQKAAVELEPAPDPHLGLARLYTYSMPDVGLMQDELNRAAARGYVLGPREFEQQGDAYRLRAEKELAAGQHAAARRDAAKARSVYARIRGYHLAGARDRELDRILAGQARGRRRWR